MIFLAGLVIRDNPQEMGLNPYGENRRKVFEPHVNLSQITDSTWNLSVREALGKSKLWILYIFIAIGSTVREIYRQQIILFGIQLGIKPVIAAMALGVIGSSSILGRLIGGFFLERIGIRRAIILFYIINVFSTLIIIRAKDQFSLFLFAIIFGFAIGGATVLEVPLIVELFGLKHLGMFIGLFETAIGLGGFIGPYYAGFLFDLMGRYNELFLSCMLFSITSLLFSIILSRAKFHQEPSY
jgi:predicted MFS family arabinose efflux permease